MSLATALNAQFLPKNERLNIHMEPFERPLVDFVDKLIEVAKKNDSSGRIRWKQDWETVAFIYLGFKSLYPISCRDFEKKMHEWQGSIQRHGILKEGEAMIQHQLEVPRPFYMMFNTIFPDQQWDKKFVQDLSKHLPQFRASGDK